MQIPCLGIDCFDKTKLELTPHQVGQAENQKSAADGVVTARLPEAYQWLLVPAAAPENPQAQIKWEAMRLSGQDALAVRASKKLKNDESLIASYAATRLRMDLDKIPLWRGDHVAIKQLVEDFARYLYLPRFTNTSVLLEAIKGGTALLTWEQDSFAYAESYDEAAGRYRGLRSGQHTSIADSDSGMLVRPDVARKQLERESTKSPSPTNGDGEIPAGPVIATPPPGSPPSAPAPTQPKRFHGTVILDPNRVGRDAARIADEVIAHLSGLVGTTVTVTLEIQAEIPSGAPDQVVRTVTENGRTLHFTSQGFEKE